MMRKFYLENTKGQQFHFKYSTGVLLSDLSGLGFTLDLSYLKYDHFHKFVKKDMPLTEISAVLVFLDGYESYQKMIDYLNRESQNLKLYYTSHDTKYAYVDVSSLSKSEIKNGVLSSEIILNKKSYWIKERLILMEISTTITGKVYPYAYEYHYQNTVSNQTNLIIGGSIKASTKLEIIGSVNNPEVSVIKQGSIVNTLRLNIIKNNIKLTISSVPDNQYMQLEDENQLFDVYATQDFEKDNFIYLDPGDVTLEFKPGVLGENLCIVYIYEYHLG